MNFLIGMNATASHRKTALVVLARVDDDCLDDHTLGILLEIMLGIGDGRTEQLFKEACALLLVLRRSSMASGTDIPRTILAIMLAAS